MKPEQLLIITIGGFLAFITYCYGSYLSNLKEPTTESFPHGKWKCHPGNELPSKEGIYVCRIMRGEMKDEWFEYHASVYIHYSNELGWLTYRYDSHLHKVRCEVLEWYEPI